MKKNGLFLICFGSLFMFVQSALADKAPAIKVEDFSKRATYRNVKISPSGKYLSLVGRVDETEVLIVMDKATRKPISSFKMGGLRKGVGRVNWVNDERLVYSATESYAYDEQVRDNGNLIGVNADGGKHEFIFGMNAGEVQIGTLVRKKESAHGNQKVIDILPEDDKNILIAFYPWKDSGAYWIPNQDAEPVIYKLNVYSGKRDKVITLPIPFSQPITDHNGVVRFSVGVDNQNQLRVFSRQANDEQWTEFKLKDFKGKNVVPLSFAENNQQVYLSADVPGEMEALFKFDLTTNEITKIYQHQKVDIDSFVWDKDDRKVVAVGTEFGKPEFHYLDDKDSTAKFHRALTKAFAGYSISIESRTKDGKEAIVYVTSDDNPGDYYLFSTESMNAEYLLTKHPEINLDLMKKMVFREFVTKDNTTLYGYLTPPAPQGKNFPLVVLVHGGPHGVRDSWEFDQQVQLLANSGYAVLQLNYRGSGGYGMDFGESGYGEWGGKMQDDITEATEALIADGTVDKDRICIMGHSYGGYASVMATIKAPHLYQCAIGSMGVYDLPMMFKEGDISDSESGLEYLKMVLGEDQKKLESRSPAFNADKIKADLLLIHGEQDRRAPIEQVQSLIKSLDNNKVKYQYIEYSKEGHGYVNEQVRAEVNQKILDFLAKNIGAKQ